ncbi:hypothetical protein phiPsa267_034 [Pseudomonas phage phiPsa267]|uniref:Uncharacterized protein n=7 Tax=Otagovirus TaxID=2560197 RepID=A0A7G9V0W8_9CAUD|nr:hypothetical protein CF96_gp032 [Pseudomonas phage phiPsa374]YP_010766760.1 hypothetical protein QGX14_gp034 [Pseudomonas phage psageK4]YP_010766943.1 hypothetical protein QGX15_gp038 [Pseudomonas phage psageK4e]YP_010767471.1 hypothetical protein QGX18_gp035 [Pseudomonas phage phiPsa347]YP_010767644.1 hypothetical protein QGX19_gp034 [Pseudomonas phage phiPsa267]YP_010767818.1 hypothetical protein QGX20_gp032 [Pseudomonas phage phiPsa300]YP_010767992.1 hypothetical protein QGX21_gp035 [Ps
MSNMTLRLDTAGLRSLIAENPTFAVEIQQAVLNNIKNDNIQQAVIDRVNGCLDKMAPRESYYGTARVIKDAKLLEVINNAVRAEVKAALTQAVEDAVSSATNAIDLRVRQEVKKVAKEVILESLTAADAKAILMEKLI